MHTDEYRNAERGKDLVNRSLDEYEKGNFSDALNLVQQGIKLNPDNVLGLQLRALCKCRLISESGIIPSSNENQIQDLISDLEIAIEAMKRFLQLSAEMFVEENKQ